MSLLVIFKPTKRLTLVQGIWDSMIWVRICKLVLVGIVVLIVLRVTHLISVWTYFRGIGVLTGLNVYCIIRGHYRRKHMHELREAALEQIVSDLEKQSRDRTAAMESWLGYPRGENDV